MKNLAIGILTALVVSLSLAACSTYGPDASLSSDQALRSDPSAQTGSKSLYGTRMNRARAVSGF